MISLAVPIWRRHSANRRVGVLIDLSVIKVGDTISDMDFMDDANDEPVLSDFNAAVF